MISAGTMTAEVIVDCSEGLAFEGGAEKKISKMVLRPVFAFFLQA
jgi:hypothetical protein